MCFVLKTKMDWLESILAWDKPQSNKSQATNHKAHATIIDWFIHSFIAWLIDWMIDCMIDGFNHWLTHWLIDWMIESLPHASYPKL